MCSSIRLHVTRSTLLISTGHFSFISALVKSTLFDFTFSFAFENGMKVLVTAFIKNKSGVNAMYGGTIHNNRGKLKLIGYSKSTNLVSGELEADLDAVIENGTCDVRNLRFTNAILMHNKVE